MYYIVHDASEELLKGTPKGSGRTRSQRSELLEGNDYRQETTVQTDHPVLILQRQLAISSEHIFSERHRFLETNPPCRPEIIVGEMTFMRYRLRNF